MGTRAKCTFSDLVRIRNYKNTFEKGEDTDCEHINKHNEYGETPFSIVLADNAQKEFVIWLIKKGGDVTQSYPGIFPLFYPLKSFDPELVTFFLEHGAKTHNINNPMQHTLLFAINHLRHKLHMKNNENKKKLLMSKCINCMTTIMKAGCPVEISQDPYQYPSCLHRAIHCGFDSIVNLLLRNGADIYSKRICENNALDLANKIKKEYTTMYCHGTPDKFMQVLLYQTWQRNYEKKQCARMVVGWNRKLEKIKKYEALYYDQKSYFSLLPRELIDLIIPFMRQNLGMLPEISSKTP